MRYKKPRKCRYHPIKFSKGCWECGYEKPGGGTCAVCKRGICLVCWIETMGAKKNG